MDQRNCARLRCYYYNAMCVLSLTVVYALAGPVEDTVEKFKADNCEDNNCK